MSVPSDQSATLLWTPPDNDGGSPLTEYIVTATPQTSGESEPAVSPSAMDAARMGAANDSGPVDASLSASALAEPVTVRMGGDATSTVLTGLVNGVTYDVTIQAANIYGVGPAATASVTPVQATAVSVAAPAITYGRDAEVSANVFGTGSGGSIDAGTMTFTVDGATIATAPVVGGRATVAIPGLHAGNHAATASFSGVPAFSPSIGEAQLFVARASTRLEFLSAPPTLLTYGQAEQLRASVISEDSAAGRPTGTAGLFDGDQFIGSADLEESSATSSTASFPLSTLPVGPHTLQVRYDGDLDRGPSVTGSGSTTIQPAETTTSLRSSVSRPTFDQSATITARVDVVAPGGAAPTGTVTFFRDGVSFVTAPVSSSTAQLNVVSLGLGTWAVTATYSGDAGHLRSTSQTLMQSVVGVETRVTVTSNSNPSVSGQAGALRIVVKPVAPGRGTPGGVIEVRDGAGEQQRFQLRNGEVSILLASFAVGSHALQVDYLGLNRYRSSSASFIQVVKTSSTVTKVVPSTNRLRAGRSIKLSFIVTPVRPGNGVPTGTVTVMVGGDPATTLALTDGRALLTVALPAGNHEVRATYGGSTTMTSSFERLLLQVT